MADGDGADTGSTKDIGDVGGSDAEGAPEPLEHEQLEEVLEENAQLKEELAKDKQELAKTSDEARSRRTASRRRWRKVGAGFLVFLTALLVLASTVSVWTRATLFQTDRFVALVEPALHDRTVTDAMANRLSDQLFQALDLQGRVDSVTGSLPPPLNDVLKRLVAPIVTSAQNYVRDKVQQEFRSPQFHNLIVQIVTVAHEKAVALIKKDYAALPNVVVQNGQIQLNLLPVATRVIRNIVVDAASLFGIPASAIPTVAPGDDPTAAIQKISQALGHPLPSDFGQVTVMTTAQLAPIQTAVERFNRLIVLILVLTVVLAVLALLVSVNRRRTVIQLGVATAVALLVAALAIRKIKESVVDGLATAAARSAANDVFNSMISSLRTLIWWIVAVALVAALVAYLLGRPAWLMRSIAWVRRSSAERPGGSPLDRWVAVHADLLRIGGVVLAILVLLLVGFGWISFLVIAALLALFIWAVEALRRRGGPAGELVPAGGVASPNGDTGGGGAQADLKTEETVVAGTATTEEIQTGPGNGGSG